MNELNQNEPKVRPQLLQVLCILTFIGSGLSLLSNLTMFMLIDMINELYNDGSFSIWLDGMNAEAFEILISVDRSFFLAQAVVYIISIVGAYQMWNLKKIGFHFYTIAQILLVILSRVYMPQLPFPLFEVMISLVFITFYARNLKLMS